MAIAGISTLTSSRLVAADGPKDYCITFPNVPGYELVGLGFSIPANGTCASWVGFSPQGNHDSPSVGTGCVNTNGDLLTLNITTTFPGEGGGFTETDGIQESLPNQNGADQFTFVDSQGGSSGSPVYTQGAACTAPSIP